MRKNISSSMKRAAISFTLPGTGRITYQEGPGQVDENLRTAIKSAMGLFFKQFELKNLDAPGKGKA